MVMARGEMDVALTARRGNPPVYRANVSNRPAAATNYGWEGSDSASASRLVDEVLLFAFY